MKPDHISHIATPCIEVRKIDEHTADVKLVHGFRAHFKKSKNVIADISHHPDVEEQEEEEASSNQDEDHCLIPKIDSKTKHRLLSRQFYFLKKENLFIT